MNKLVKKDLKLKSRAVVKVQSLTTLQRQKCLERCSQMLNWLKSNPRKVTAFSEEKELLHRCLLQLLQHLLPCQEAQGC